MEKKKGSVTPEGAAEPARKDIKKVYVKSYT